MKGIEFVEDEHGEKRAVLIDLQTWGDVWEEFFDALLARERTDDADEDWDAVKARLSRDEISE